MFEVTEIAAGTAIGVYFSDDPALITELDKAVAGKTGVSQITAKEYDAAVKKKPHNFNSFPHSNTKSPMVRLSQVAGVVVENPEPFEDVDAKLVESVESALGNVGKVTPPPVGEEPVVKSKKK